MSRSSIFSFETLALGTFPVRRIAAFVVVALLCFGVLEQCARAFGDRSRHYLMAEFPYGYGEKLHRILTLEREGAVPRMMVLGDSTFETAMNPVALERELGWPRGAIVSITSGLVHPDRSEWIARDLFERRKLRAEVVVVGWSFVVFNGTDPHVKRAMAALPAYAAMREMHGRARLFDHLELVRAWRAVHEAIAAGPPFLAPSPTLLMTEGWPEYRNRYPDSEAEVRARFEAAAIEAFDSFKVTPELLARVEHTLASIKASGARVVFVLTPASPDLMRSTPRAAECLAQVRAQLRPILERQQVTLIDAAEMPGRESGDFADPVHMNAYGSEKFVPWLAPLIEPVLLGE